MCPPHELQVFTSASILVFKTFACDDAAVDGKSFLRADYSISCQSRWHTFFICYAGLMILVSRFARGRVGVQIFGILINVSECVFAVSQMNDEKRGSSRYSHISMHRYYS